MSTALPRYDWFQTDEMVTLTILKRGVSPDECRVSFSSSNGREMRVEGGGQLLFSDSLFDNVRQQEIIVSATPNKIELKLPKAVAGKWESLLAKRTSEITLPQAGGSKKNWDAIEKEAVREEEEEALEGDAAVNKYFRKLYADASDEVKKAMMKSYQESAGTVLSTNWEDIKKKKTEVKPPDSMEFKRFEQ